MAFTANYNLKKPEQSEQFDVAHQNSNMDIIDSALTPTADPESVPTGLSGKLSEWVGWIANRFKAITGKDNWYDTPAKTMEGLNTDLTALQGDVSAHLAESVTDADGVHGLRIQEGTWTPTLAGDSTFGANTYSVRTGSYIRIGKLCYVEGAITLSAKDPAMAGNVYVSGFPIAPNSPAGQQAVLSVSRVGGITYPTGYTQLSLPMSQTVPSAFLNVSGSGLAVSGLNATYISNTSAIRFSGFYTTA